MINKIVGQDNSKRPYEYLTELLGDPMYISLRQKVIHVIDMGVKPCANEYEVRVEALQSRKQDRRHLGPALENTGS